MTLPAISARRPDSSRAAPGEHRRVQVMTAGVHRSVDFRGIRHPGGLGYRQRVHVAAQQDRRGRPAAVQHGRHRRQLPALGDLERQPGERVEHLSLRSRQVKPDLRFTVDVVPDLGDVRGDVVGLIEYRCHVRKAYGRRGRERRQGTPDFPTRRSLNSARIADRTVAATSAATRASTEPPKPPPIIFAPKCPRGEGRFHRDVGLVPGDREVVAQRRVPLGEQVADRPVHVTAGPRQEIGDGAGAGAVGEHVPARWRSTGSASPRSRESASTPYGGAIGPSERRRAGGRPPRTRPAGRRTGRRTGRARRRCR